MKLAVITGASSGIGEATAREPARGEYRVVLVARNGERLRELAASLGEGAVAAPCDASDGAAVLALAERVLRDLRTLSPEDCARIIARTIQHPKRHVVYPHMLRMYTWLYAIAPWATRSLLRR